MKKQILNVSTVMTCIQLSSCGPSSFKTEAAVPSASSNSAAASMSSGTGTSVSTSSASGGSSDSAAGGSGSISGTDSNNSGGGVVNVPSPTATPGVSGSGNVTVPSSITISQNCVVTNISAGQFCRAGSVPVGMGYVGSVLQANCCAIVDNNQQPASFGTTFADTGNANAGKMASNKYMYNMSCYVDNAVPVGFTPGHPDSPTLPCALLNFGGTDVKVYGNPFVNGQSVYMTIGTGSGIKSCPAGTSILQFENPGDNTGTLTSIRCGTLSLTPPAVATPVNPLK